MAFVVFAGLVGAEVVFEDGHGEDAVDDAMSEMRRQNARERRIAPSYAGSRRWTDRAADQKVKPNETFKLTPDHSQTTTPPTQQTGQS